MAGGESPSETPRRRLYGRSRGKAMRAGQKRLLAEALPRVEIAPEALSGAQPFAFDAREIWLEIGFGAGEHLIEQAKAHPDIGFIGCELFLNGLAAALAALEREKLANVRLRGGDAVALLDAVPDAYFARVFLLYPDPWPKRRHNKRRVVSDSMIGTLARALKPGGDVRFATDVDDYAGWTLRRFLASAEFRWAAERADDWRTPWPNWRPTRYEAKARKERRGSVYLTFVRV
jgi:tRNA (guanine-N7-)-methyltransferase